VRRPALTEPPHGPFAQAGSAGYHDGQTRNPRMKITQISAAIGAEVTVEGVPLSAAA
jgi:hypothetical protein